MPSDLSRGGVAALGRLAEEVLRRAARDKIMLATAESCTGGLLASLLTDIEGRSAQFDRGFVAYTDEAKAELLGIEPIDIRRHGAVSREIALAMARGAIAGSNAGVAVSITGFAGPARPIDEEGLVYLAACRRDGAIIHRECHFGPAGRDRTRELAVAGAMEMLIEAMP